jgi:hypothetical protein
MVWIELEQGNTNVPPIWSSAMWSISSVPTHSDALPDESDVSIKGIPGMPIPASSFNASEYGKVHAWQMKSGARLEFDETEGFERVQIYHPSGSHIEMLQDGTINIGAASNVRIQATAGQLERYASGAVTDTFEDSVTTTVSGEWIQTIDKKYDLIVGGIAELAYGGVDLVSSGDWNGTLQATRNMKILGNEYLSVGQQMSVNAGTDLYLAASGLASLVAQNSITLGGTPTQLALELSAFNGRSILQSTDVTGLASSAFVECDGGGPIQTLTTGVSLGGSPITTFEATGLGTATISAALSTTVSSPLIQLGGTTAIQPLVLGIQWATLWSTFLVQLDLHTHLVFGVIPTLPPTVPISPSIAPLIPNTLSTTSFTD